MFQVQIRFGNKWQAVGAPTRDHQRKAREIATQYPSHAVRIVKVAA